MIKQCGGLIALSPVGQLYLLFVGTGWAKLPGCWPVRAVWLSWFCHRADSSWLNGTPLSGRICNSGLGVTETWRSDRWCVAPVRSLVGSSLILTDWSFAALISGLGNFLSPETLCDWHHHHFFHACWWPNWDCVTSGSGASLRLSWLITVS